MIIEKCKLKIENFKLRDQKTFRNCESFRSAFPERDSSVAALPQNDTLCGPLFQTLGILLLSVSLASAQAAGWNCVVNQPPPNQLNVENLWWVTITNREQAPVEVYLYLDLAKDAMGQVFHSKTNSFTVPPGGKRVSSSDVTNLKDANYDSGLGTQAQMSKSFPPGMYTMCAEVHRAQDEVLLARGCREQRVSGAQPPRLLLPVNGARVENETPSFSWASPNPLPPSVRPSYRFKLCEVLPGMEPASAISGSPYYSADGLAATQLAYSLSAKSLTPDRTYCWQVQAVDERGTPVSANEGKSEVFAFAYKAGGGGAGGTGKPGKGQEGGKYEFGDAPDGTDAGYGNKVTGRFPTLPAHNGVRHKDPTREWLGFPQSGAENAPVPSVEPESKQVDLDDREEGLRIASLWFPEPCIETHLHAGVNVAKRNDPLHPYDGSDAHLLYLNVLADWNKDGVWSDAGMTCVATEWCVRNFSIDVSKWPGGTTFQEVETPKFKIGSPAGFVWMRVTLTYGQKAGGPKGWDGTGEFGSGETEDYGYGLARGAAGSTQGPHR